MSLYVFRRSRTTEPLLVASGDTYRLRARGQLVLIYEMRVSAVLYEDLNPLLCEPDT